MPNTCFMSSRHLIFACLRRSAWPLRTRTFHAKFSTAYNDKCPSPFNQHVPIPVKNLNRPETIYMWPRRSKWVRCRQIIGIDTALYFGLVPLKIRKRSCIKSRQMDTQGLLHHTPVIPVSAQSACCSARPFACRDHLVPHCYMSRQCIGTSLWKQSYRWHFSWPFNPMLCYKVICIAPLTEGHWEALSAQQAGEKKSLPAKSGRRRYSLEHHTPECRRSVIPECSKGPILG